MIAYIGLGSNLENPEQQIRQAMAEIRALAECQVTAVSSLYRSQPLGPADQPDYINAVLCLETSLSPHHLLDALQAIEQAHGRQRLQHWGPRTLDLDLLLYDDQIIDDQRLIVPHPGLGQRNFVLYPLAEIAEASMILPGLGTLAALLEKVSGDGLEKLNQ